MTPLLAFVKDCLAHLTRPELAEATRLTLSFLAEPVDGGPPDAIVREGVIVEVDELDAMLARIEGDPPC